MRGRRLRRIVVPLLVVTSLLALRPAACAAVYFTEAEHLLLLGGASTAYATNLSRALGGRSVYLRGSRLAWRVDLPKGSYWLWVRARSGWEEDRTFAWSPQVRYSAAVDGREAALSPRLDTLVYESDGHNFVWASAGPLELEQGRHEVQVGCAWEWAHLDALLLTDDAAFDPAQAEGLASARPVISSWIAWPTNPYADVSPLDRPPDQLPAAMTATVPVGGTAILAAGFHTLPGSQLSTHLLLSMSELRDADGNTIPAAACRLYELQYCRTRGGQVAADPLTPLNTLGALTVPPAETAYLWAILSARGVRPGVYEGALSASSQFAYEDDRRSISIKITVAEPSLPETSGLSIFNWWGYSDSPHEWWEAQLAGGTNVFKAIVQHHIGFRFDEQGNLVGELDFTRLDRVAGYVKRADGLLLLEWYLHAPQFAGLTSRASAGAKPLEPFSPAWEKAFRTLVTAIRDHLLATGLDYDHFAEYTYDENIGPDFIRAGKIIRDLDPKLRIFSDRTATLEEYKAAAPYIDIWCPHFGGLSSQAADGRLEFMRSTGKPIWAYDEGMDQRLRSAYGNYRLRFWTVWEYGLQGCTYWKYSGDDVGMVYDPLLPDPRPVTSRRWEAWKKGLEDYRCLQALRARGTDPAALEAAVGEVLSRPGDVALADDVLGRLLQGGKTQ
ncbi:MAG: hypothetical protein FJX75_20730 [Armatimonadetes bacterium]|nr:hypothetical protein [Armatimonadota bacterium]